LAKAGHHAMRHYVATTEAFPLPIHKEEISWTCLVKAAEGKEEMVAKLEVLEKNFLLKGQLIDYVWGGGSQLRGELIFKARAAVPGVYGLPGKLKEEELHKVLTWLMQSLKLIHPDIDAKACTCAEDKPWYHPIFLQLIKAQWWGKKGKAKQ
ncbi:hypothetical protein SCLCIDRAFT_42151, partial [Scleroderma citrinum Foug A]